MVIVPIEIRAEQLGKSFGDHVVLSEIDLTIHSGEIVCIVGASGSGKTVLLDTLVGLIAPDSGRVLAADHNADSDADGQPPLRDLTTITERELDLVRLHWAVVFQRNALFSGTVRENLALWLREHTKLDQAEIDRRARASLEAVALDVADVLDKDRDELSGGMAKRVAIARAIACDPLVMFYDEPTTGLDPMVGSAMHDLIWRTHVAPPPAQGEGFAFRDLGFVRPRRTPSAKRTTIIVTHDRDLLRRLRPRVIMLHESRVCYDGPYARFGEPDCPPAQAYLQFMPVLHEREIQ
ncbi:MAG: ATP-binding cassette domain-containing protein [Phycisphaerales bacterium]|nr:ATP-binding cassette domain-containing protein [Phycisphaerales bacterium]